MRTVTAPSPQRLENDVEAPPTPPQTQARATAWDLPHDARLLLLAGYIAARTSAAADPLALPSAGVGDGPPEAPSAKRRRRGGNSAQTAKASTQRHDAAWDATVATPKAFTADRLVHLFAALQHIVEDVGAAAEDDDDVDDDAVRATRSPTAEAFSHLPVLHAAGWLTGGDALIGSDSSGRRMRCLLEPAHAQRLARMVGVRLNDLMESVA